MTTVKRVVTRVGSGRTKVGMSKREREALDRHPMRRTESLPMLPSHVEAAYCPWCVHVRGAFASRGCGRCVAPSNYTPIPKGERRPCGERLTVDPPWCSNVNKNGRCAEYRPNHLTRLLRWLGIRQPRLVPMVEPRGACEAFDITDLREAIERALPRGGRDC